MALCASPTTACDPVWHCVPVPHFPCPSVALCASPWLQQLLAKGTHGSCQIHGSWGYTDHGDIWIVGIHGSRGHMDHVGHTDHSQPTAVPAPCPLPRVSGPHRQHPGAAGALWGSSGVPHCWSEHCQLCL